MVGGSQYENCIRRPQHQEGWEQLIQGTPWAAEDDSGRMPPPPLSPDTERMGY